MSIAMTIQIDESVKARLDEAAAELGVSPEKMAADLLQSGTEPVELTDWQEAKILAAIEEAKREGTVPEKEVWKWMNSFGTANELPMPKARKVIGE